MACAGEAKHPLLANLAQGERRVQRLALPLIFNIEHQDRLAGRAIGSQRVKAILRDGRCRRGSHSGAIQVERQN